MPSQTWWYSKQIKVSFNKESTQNQAVWKYIQDMLPTPPGGGNPFPVASNPFSHAEWGWVGMFPFTHARLEMCLQNIFKISLSKKTTPQFWDLIICSQLLIFTNVHFCCLLEIRAQPNEWGFLGYCLLTGEQPPPPLFTFVRHWNFISDSRVKHSLYLLNTIRKHRCNSTTTQQQQN